jgi:hypothetical protein
MQVIIGLLRSAMMKAGAKNFLIDGFPRALDQAEMFEKMVKQPEMVLAFDCPEVGGWGWAKPGREQVAGHSACSGCCALGQAATGGALGV